MRVAMLTVVYLHLAGALWVQSNPNLEYDVVTEYRMTVCAVNSDNVETCGDVTDTTSAPNSKDWLGMYLIIRHRLTSSYVITSDHNTCHRTMS